VRSGRLGETQSSRGTPADSSIEEEAIGAANIRRSTTSEGRQPSDVQSSDLTVSPLPASRRTVPPSTTGPQNVDRFASDIGALMDVR